MHKNCRQTFAQAIANYFNKEINIYYSYSNKRKLYYLMISSEKIRNNCLNKHKRGFWCLNKSKIQSKTMSPNGDVVTRTELMLLAQSVTKYNSQEVMWESSPNDPSPSVCMFWFGVRGYVGCHKYNIHTTHTHAESPVPSDVDLRNTKDTLAQHIIGDEFWIVTYRFTNKTLLTPDYDDGYLPGKQWPQEHGDNKGKTLREMLRKMNIECYIYQM